MSNPKEIQIDGATCMLNQTTEKDQKIQGKLNFQKSVIKVQPEIFPQTSFNVDPMHTTHSGGKGEYLHDWYAYLEGYSSEFVRSITKAYFPEAKTIIDPFAGVGTTPLTLSLMGISSFYSEINPAMRKIINTKLSVANLGKNKKRKLQEKLLFLASDIKIKIKKASESLDLRRSYDNSFGGSVFFTENVYRQVLQSRSVIDKISLEDHLLASALETAIMSQLVNCSLLKRAGDVRYKTEKELTKGLPDFIEAIQKQLELMANDCILCPEGSGKALLIMDNAKNLYKVDALNAEGVITSPPYLNGTNYFRNTKLELWFVREIIDNKSLRTFRDAVVTSGINDVTISKGKNIHPVISQLYQELKEKAYDQRIAKMVSGYFEEMGTVFLGLSKHLKKGSLACIDIGDSVYAGIHVPTHELLSEISRDHGFKLLKTVTLRKRKSHDGSSLSQTLLVLENNPNKKVRSRKNSIKSGKYFQAWGNFKDSFPHTQHPFSKRNWGNELHSVCSYQGKMKPSLAYHLVKCFTKPGDVILDPFSGSGTIPFEAALNGCKAYGLDIGLLAVSISNAKLKFHDQKIVYEIINNIRKNIEKNKPSKKSISDCKDIKFNKTIPEYFHEKTLTEILCARDFFSKNQAPEDGNWALVLACLLHILHGNRPYALSRTSHPITPYAPSGDFIYKNLVERLTNKVKKSIETDRPASFIDGHCFKADILAAWPDDIDNIDAIITSPPFFDSTKFYLTNWMRYWFCGWSREDFNEKPKTFLEVIQKKSFNVYDLIFKQCCDRLKKGGVVVFHLGESEKCNMVECLMPYAKKYFKVQDAFTESVRHCENHGVVDKGSVKGHQYLVLEKTQ